MFEPFRICIRLFSFSCDPPWDQIAKPLEEAKHRLFSHYLVKGMEGDADINNDNVITAKELHIFLKQEVIQQSGGSQVPKLQGDAERVLVRFQ